MNNIIIFFIGLILFWINPLFSYLLILIWYMRSINRNLLIIFLLLANIIVINIYKIPTSDHYRYYRLFHDLVVFDTNKMFYEFLSDSRDYIYYVYMYFCNKNFNYLFWVASYACFTFFCVIYSFEKYESLWSKKLIFLFFDPFNIKRWTLGMGMYLYGSLKKNRIFWKILGVCTHVSLLVFPMINIF